MKPIEKYKIIRKLKKAENLMLKAESEISSIASFIQPYFKQEIYVTPTTDGAMITDENGELEPVNDFLKTI